MNIINFRPYFTPQAIALRLKGLPPIKTTILDTVFKRKVNHPLATVGKSDITELGQAAPLIMRGAPSLKLDGGPTSVAEYEPYEAAYNKSFTAADLNNLKALDSTGIKARLAGVDDNLRRTCRATAEALASLSLTGTISWPVALEGGGMDTYEVNLGNTGLYNPDKLWDADAKLRDVYNDLDNMETAVQESGYGGDVEFMAGKLAYIDLLALADAYSTNPNGKIKVEVSKEGIRVGEFLVKKMAERYYDPLSKTNKPKVPDHKIMAYATDAVHTVFYCALDDLDGKLQPFPYFSKPIDTKDPSGVKIVGRSKPFPVPITKAICWASVRSE